MLKKLLIAKAFTFLFLFSSPVAGQAFHSLQEAERSLDSLFKKAAHCTNDSLRLAVNKEFERLLQRAVRMKGSFGYPFDSLKHLSRLTSPDEKFRIYNWNMPMDAGGNRYFAIMQIRGDKGEFHELAFHDGSDSVADPEKVVLDPAHWYGSLYYKIIPVESNGMTFYTLLGWDGFSKEITQKIIDVCYFPKPFSPLFGFRFFNKYNDGWNTRIIFRFSSSVTMNLKMDEQSVITSRKWNKSRKVFEEERKKMPMLVCDRLSSIYPEMEGMYQYYVPEANVVDAFIFENGDWNFTKDIDARNPSGK